MKINKWNRKKSKNQKKIGQIQSKAIKFKEKTIKYGIYKANFMNKLIWSEN